METEKLDESKRKASNPASFAAVATQPPTPPTAPRVIPRQLSPSATAATLAHAQVQAQTASAQAAKMTQAQFENYMAMAAEMQTLLKQERQRTQHLQHEVRRIQEHYHGMSTQQDQRIQGLEAERKAVEIARKEAEKTSSEYAQQLNRLKQELAKVGKNWEIIKKLADSKDQFEQLLTKYTDSEAKFQAIFDNSSQSIRKVDEMMREIHRRFSLIESSWDIEAKQRKQGDTDLRGVMSQVRSETEVISGALHSLHQHMGQYEIAIHSLIGQIEKRDRSNHDLHRTLKQARDSQEKTEQALGRIESRQTRAPRPHSREQAIRIVRRLAYATQSRFLGLEALIQNGFKIGAKAIQLDAVMRRLDLLQGQSEAQQTVLGRLEKQTQALATTENDAQYERLTQFHQHIKTELMDRLSSMEDALMNSQEKVRRDLDALKAENELFRSVLMRWMEESRQMGMGSSSEWGISAPGKIPSVAVASSSAEPPPASPAMRNTASPLEELLALKENKIQKLREDLRLAKTDASRKQLQLILDATLMQRDQISKILKTSSHSYSQPRL